MSSIYMTGFRGTSGIHTFELMATTERETPRFFNKIDLDRSLNRLFVVLRATGAHGIAFAAAIDQGAVS